MTQAPTRKKIPNGYVIWQGNSQLTNDPIMCILTGTRRPSSNPKTGPMLQTWIMRSDIHPLQAVRSNGDRAQCGSCPLKGDGGKGRTCYVNLATVSQVYQAYLKGNYPSFTGVARNRVRSRAVRLGAYGDPAAVPFEVWEELLSLTRSTHTGYTNQWREGCLDRRYQDILMASVVSPSEYELAKAMGWRTYRVRTRAEPVIPGEQVCPGSEEANNSLLCMSCGLCNGLKTEQPQDIVVIAHGIGSQNFRKSGSAGRAILQGALVEEETQVQAKGDYK